MMLLFVILVLLLVFGGVITFSSKTRFTPRGKLLRNQKLSIHGNSYTVQEFEFETYNSAHSSYFKIVNEIGGNDTIIETKYDLYDWSYSYMRYEKHTVAIKYFRSFNSIQIAKSDYPVNLSSVEHDNPFLHY